MMFYHFYVFKICNISCRIRLAYNLRLSSNRRSRIAHHDGFSSVGLHGTVAKIEIEVWCWKAVKLSVRALFCLALSELKPYNMSPVTSAYISVDSLRSSSSSNYTSPRTNEPARFLCRARPYFSISRRRDPRRRRAVRDGRWLVTAGRKPPSAPSMHQAGHAVRQLSGDHAATRYFHLSAAGGGSAATCPLTVQQPGHAPIIPGPTPVVPRTNTPTPPRRAALFR